MKKKRIFNFIIVLALLFFAFKFTQHFFLNPSNEGDLLASLYEELKPWINLFLIVFFFIVAPFLWICFVGKRNKTD